MFVSNAATDQLDLSVRVSLSSRSVFSITICPFRRGPSRADQNLNETLVQVYNTDLRRMQVLYL